MWIEAIVAKKTASKKPYGRAEFEQLLGDCGTATDVPPAVVWKEPIEAYPEAKVALVERDEEEWFRSFEGLVAGITNPIGRYFLQYADPYWYVKVVCVCYRPV